MDNELDQAAMHEQSPPNSMALRDPLTLGLGSDADATILALQTVESDRLFATATDHLAQSNLVL